MRNIRLNLWKIVTVFKSCIFCSSVQRNLFFLHCAFYLCCHFNIFYCSGEKWHFFENQMGCILLDSTTQYKICDLLQRNGSSYMIIHLCSSKWVFVPKPRTSPWFLIWGLNLKRMFFFNGLVIFLLYLEGLWLFSSISLLKYLLNMTLWKVISVVLFLSYKSFRSCHTKINLW